MDTKESIRTDFASARWYGSLWLLDLLFSSFFFHLLTWIYMFLSAFASYIAFFSLSLVVLRLLFFSLNFMCGSRFLIKITRHRTQIKNRTGENENLHVTCFLHAFNGTISCKNFNGKKQQQPKSCPCGFFLECFRFVFIWIDGQLWVKLAWTVHSIYFVLFAQTLFLFILSLT